MKQMLCSIMLIVLVQLLAVPAHGASEIPETNGSPYFFVESENPEVDRLPLKSTAVEVNIAGVIADVTVRQVYENQGKRPLEALYVFPASTRAAVYGMTLQIGERRIEARIEKKEVARQIYEKAKHSGRSASLLEQERPNVFQMNVANILPGDVIEVELRYTELLVPEDGIYSFVYPTVVGPRYTGPPEHAESPAADWTANPYFSEGEPPSSRLEMRVSIHAGVPITKMACDTHQTHIGFTGKQAAEVRLAESEAYGGNRDFVLQYALSGEAIESGLLLFEGEKENHFLLMIQPPESPALSEIPPREYLFIVDVSGSMNGFPLEISKKLIRDLIGGLRPSDRFNLLLFAGGSSLLAEESIAASPANIRKAVRLIDHQRGGGGTRILPALQRALALPAADGCSRTVVMATDGYVSVEKAAFDLIRDNLGDANFFAFGIGSSVNRYLIEGMARAGMGEPFVVTRPEEAPGVADKFRELIQSPVLTDISVDFGDFDAYAAEPKELPDVFAGRPVILFGKYQGSPQGTLRLKGTTGKSVYRGTIDAGKAKPDPRNSALPYLWARHRIARLSDYQNISPEDDTIQEVVRLGLTYNLLTRYTSFVAVDSVKRVGKNGKSVTVKQPLPLPEGVSDLALGRGMAMTKAAPVSAGRTRQTLAPSCVDERKTSYHEECSARPDVKDAVAGIRLVSVGVSNPAVEAEFTRLVESVWMQLRACFAGLLTGSGKRSLKLTFDRSGRLTDVDVTACPELANRHDAVSCIRNVISAAVPVRLQRDEKVVVRVLIAGR